MRDPLLFCVSVLVEAGKIIVSFFPQLHSLRERFCPTVLVFQLERICATTGVYGIERGSCTPKAL